MSHLETDNSLTIVVNFCGGAKDRVVSYKTYNKVLSLTEFLKVSRSYSPTNKIMPKKDRISTFRRTLWSNYYI